MNKRREQGKEEVDGDTLTKGQPWPPGLGALGTQYSPLKRIPAVGLEAVIHSSPAPLNHTSDASTT